MYYTGEVKAQDLNQIEEDFRRELKHVDAQWRSRFQDLERQLGELRQARIRETDDGLMTMLSWSPLILVIFILLFAR